MLDDIQNTMLGGLPFPLSTYDRPSLALSNLLAQRWGAIGRSMVAPDTLTPTELETISQRMGGKAGAENPILKTFLDITTNPLFLIGLLLSTHFPAMHPSKIVEWANKVVPGARGLSGLSAYISSAERIFHGTKVWPVMKEHVLDVIGVKTEQAEKLGRLIADFEAAKKRPITTADWAKVVAKADGLDSMEGSLAIHMAQAKVPLAKPLLKKITLDPAEQALYDGVRNDILEDMWKQQTGAVRGKSHDEGISAWNRWVRGVVHRGYVPQEWERNPVAGVAVKRYWPHYVMPKGAQIEQMLAEARVMADEEAMRVKYPGLTAAQIKSRRQHLRQALQQLPYQNASPHLLPRRRGLTLVPDRAFLQRYLSEYIDPEAWGTLTAAIDKKQAALARRLHAYAEKREPFGSRFTKQVAIELKHHGYTRTAAYELAQRMDAAIQSGDRTALEDLIARITAPHNMVMEYSLDMNILSRYVSDTAAEISWLLKGRGEELEEASRELAPLPRQFLADTYIELLRGRQTLAQNMQSIMIGEYELKMLNGLNSDWAKKWLPESIRKWMVTKMEEARALPASSIPSKIASYFYVSTLGFNPSPALKNMLQSAITVLPMLGPEAYFRGLSGVLSRFYSKYLPAREAKLSDPEAMTQAFPEFEAARLEPALVSRAIGPAGGDIEIAAAPVQIPTGAVGRTTQAIKSASLKLFSTTERFNRLVAFYAAHDTVMASGAQGLRAAKGLSPAESQRMLAQEAMDAGWTVTQRTQFPAGPLGAVPLTASWPAPLRQFTHFPMHYLQFLRLPQTMGGGLGTLGRAAMTSIAIGHTVKGVLGVDVEEGLSFGALPMPSFPNTPGYPWPLVPPIVNVGLSLVQALDQGDMSRLGMTASMLVPGGLAARRIIRGVNEARVMAAGYEEADENGRIPIYNERGARIGAFTPMQLIMRAMGLNPMDIKKEQELTLWLVKQRDQIRNYRLQYIEALAKNDMGEAEAVQAAFRKRYPELGPLQVKRTDLLAVENRRNLARVERVRRGLPREYQPFFEEALQATLGSTITTGAWQAPDVLLGMVSQTGQTGQTTDSYGASGYATIGGLNPFGNDDRRFRSPGAFQSPFLADGPFGTT